MIIPILIDTAAYLIKRYICKGSNPSYADFFTVLRRMARRRS